MPTKGRKRPQTRMVHVRLSDELHKRLRIRAAEDDTTLQDWVTSAIQNELDRQSKERNERLSERRG